SAVAGPAHRAGGRHAGPARVGPGQRVGAGGRVGQAPAPGVGAAAILAQLERHAVLAERLGEPAELTQLHAAEQAPQELERGGIGQPGVQPARPEIAEEDGGPRAVVLLERRAHAAFERVLAKHVRGEGVDGPDLDPVELGEHVEAAPAGGRRVAEELEPTLELLDPLARDEPREPRAEPVAHLVGGAHRERERQEPRGLRTRREKALEKEPHDAGGLARARAGLDRRRSAHGRTISQYRVTAGVHSGFRRTRPWFFRQIQPKSQYVQCPPCSSATRTKNHPSRMNVAKSATACSTSSRHPVQSVARKRRVRRSSRISSTDGSPRRYSSTNWKTASVATARTTSAKRAARMPLSGTCARRSNAAATVVAAAASSASSWSRSKSRAASRP